MERHQLPIPRQLVRLGGPQVLPHHPIHHRHRDILQPIRRARALLAHPPARHLGRLARRHRVHRRDTQDIHHPAIHRTIRHPRVGPTHHSQEGQEHHHQVIHQLVIRHQDTHLITHLLAIRRPATHRKAIHHQATHHRAAIHHLQDRHPLNTHHQAIHTLHINHQVPTLQAIPQALHLVLPLAASHHQVHHRVSRPQIQAIAHQVRQVRILQGILTHQRPPPATPVVHLPAILQVATRRRRGAQWMDHWGVGRGWQFLWILLQDMHFGENWGI